MLPKILASLALTVGVANISIASEVQRFPTELICGNEAGMAEVLEKYGEIPFATMTSSREVPIVGLTVNPLVIFVNPKTKTYTIIEQLTADVYCVVAIGENINPYVEQK
jgi:succinyl-CoA synthetase alpha subunit